MATPLKASINNNPSNNKSAVTSILSINEMNYQPKICHPNVEIPSHLFQNVLEPSNEQPEANSSKLTLIAAIRNALINKDTDSFLFCLEQTDKVLIETTVKGLDKNSIKMFIEKLIDLFQRSLLYKLNIIPWMKLIIKYHYFIILSMNADVIQNLNKIKALIGNYTKNYSILIKLKKKLNYINKESSTMQDDQSTKDKGKFEPLLLYEESDDEEEKDKKRMKKEALSHNGIKAYNGEESEEFNNQMNIDYNIDEDDYFDIEDEGENDNEEIVKNEKTEEEEEENEADLDLDT